MNLIKIKCDKVLDKSTDEAILEIHLKIEVEKLLNVKKKYSSTATDEIFDGLIKQIKKECNCGE